MAGRQASAGAIRAGRAFVEIFADDRKLARGLRRAHRRLRNFQQSINTLGQQMVRLSALMAVPFGFSAKAYMDFEKEMANVSTMVDDVELHMGRFAGSIRRMSMQFGESTKTMARGLYDILSATIAPANAIEVLTVATKAAIGGMSDTKTSADALTTMLNSYGLAAEDAADVSDLLFTVVRRGKTTYDRLAQGIGSVAAIASQGGLALEELGASLAMLTRNGLNTDEAVTAVRATVMAFMKPTKEAAEYAEQFGIAMNSMTLRTIGLIGVLKRLQGMPAETVAAIFPNIRAIKAVAPLMQNLKEYEHDIRLMGDRSGMAGIAFRKMTRTLAYAFARAKQTAINAMIEIGEAMRKPLMSVTERIREGMDAFRVWIRENKEAVMAAVALVLSVGALGAGLVALSMILTPIVAAFGVLATTAIAVTSAFSAIIGIFGLLSGVALGVVASITAVAAAIAGLIAYNLVTDSTLGQSIISLRKEVGTLAGDFQEAWEGIKDALASGNLGLAFKIAMAAVKVEWQRGLLYLRETWDDFVHDLKRSSAKAGKTILSVFGTGRYDLGELVKVPKKRKRRTVEEIRAALAEQERLKHSTDPADFLSYSPSRVRKLNQELAERLRATAKIRQEQEKLNQLVQKAKTGRERTADLRVPVLGKDPLGFTVVTDWKSPDELSDDVAGEKQPFSERAKKAFDEFMKSLRDTDLGRGVKPDKLDTAGTFSAVTRGLGLGSSALDRTADATEKTARNTEEMLRNQRDGASFA